jgi:hypothetical protein
VSCWTGHCFFDRCFWDGQVIEPETRNWTQARSMETEVNELPQQTATERSPLSRLMVAILASCFYGWPAVLYVYFPAAPSGNTREGSFLIVAGSFLWFLSCCGIWVIGKPHRISRTKIIAAWFLGWPPFVIVYSQLILLIEHPDWIDWLLLLPGSLFWLFCCYGIYDVLFTMAEARWPVATIIREVLRSVFRIFRAYHGQHHSDSR